MLSTVYTCNFCILYDRIIGNDSFFQVVIKEEMKTLRAMFNGLFKTVFRLFLVARIARFN